jgi:hypothetical protein
VLPKSCITFQLKNLICQNNTLLQLQTPKKLQQNKSAKEFKIISPSEATQQHQPTLARTLHELSTAHDKEKQIEKENTF